ncbi:unnamed protein product [Penicillium camemberti]|uniref:Str. FM013 n=1 Tax=Penicillium camemberti (strain FM 013) TaxID=1429867 RepID=A0A0G4NVN9_PENC3|nr:unnamed protein product [Penicillium camemberti]
MDCHLVVLEAKEDNHATDDKNRERLACRAMVRANRKVRRQSNSTLWGVLSDDLEFNLQKLDHQGRWSYIHLQQGREGWQAIANLLVYIILQALGMAAY